jgi:hypothetical protein
MQKRQPVTSLLVDHDAPAKLITPSALPTDKTFNMLKSMELDPIA